MRIGGVLENPWTPRLRSGRVTQRSRGIIAGRAEMPGENRGLSLSLMKHLGRCCSQSIVGAVIRINLLMTNFARLFFSLMLLVAVSGCGSGGFVESELRGRIYKVPSQYVVMSSPTLRSGGNGPDSTTRGVLLSIPVEVLKKHVPGFVPYPWMDNLLIIVNEEKSYQSMLNH